MYESFFELKCKPFSLLPDPDFLFMSSRHSIALSLLDYSLTGQAGFCVITGDIGSGKTTLVRAFLGRVGREFSVGLISNTHMQVRDIAGWALTAFGQKQTSTNPAEVYQELMAYLIAEYGAGRQCILIVDEAQNLSIEALEELRLLSNINSGKDLLLQILLVGQPELLEKLKRPELRQFAQRIAVSHHLSPLNFAETRKYIEHRLAVAGATKPVFSEMAIGAVQYFSGGVPRLINSICDLCLVYAFADGVREIDEGLVFRVITDRQLSGIAPFANANLVDDPAVRAEISVIARSGKAEPEAVETSPAEVVAKAAAATTPAPSPESAVVAPAPSPEPVMAPSAAPVPAAERVVTAAATVDAEIPAPARVTEAPAPIALASRRTPAPVEPRPVEARIEPAAMPEPSAKSDGFFGNGNEEDSDLLLTVEAEDSESTVETGARLNGAHDSRVVILHADASDRIGTTRTSGGKPEVEHPFPVIEGDRAGSRNADDSLRVEETLLVAAPGGTAKPSERSWWRRAFRRGG